MGELFRYFQETIRAAQEFDAQVAKLQAIQPFDPADLARLLQEYTPDELITLTAAGINVHQGREKAWFDYTVRGLWGYGG